MKIEISFDEVSALVSERYGKQVSLARVSADGALGPIVQQSFINSVLRD